VPNQWTASYTLGKLISQSWPLSYRNAQVRYAWSYTATPPCAEWFLNIKATLHTHFLLSLHSTHPTWQQPLTQVEKASSNAGHVHGYPVSRGLRHRRKLRQLVTRNYYDKRHVKWAVSNIQDYGVSWDFRFSRRRDVVSRSLVETDRRFVILMIQAESTSKASVIFYWTTRHNTPQGSHLLDTCCLTWVWTTVCHFKMMIKYWGERA
jgi:hypothetical protein